MYFQGVEPVFNRPQRNDDSHPNKDMYLFDTGGRSKGMVEVIELDELSLKQAHRYVLLHLDGNDQYQWLVIVANL